MAAWVGPSRNEITRIGDKQCKSSENGYRAKRIGGHANFAGGGLGFQTHCASLADNVGENFKRLREVAACCVLQGHGDSEKAEIRQPDSSSCFHPE